MRSTFLSREEVLERAMKKDTLIEEIVFAKKLADRNDYALLKRIAQVGWMNQARIFNHIVMSAINEMKQAKQEIPLLSFIESPDITDQISKFTRYTDEPLLINPSLIVSDPLSLFVI